MKNAANTWTGEWWQYGGGGTVWDSMAYDAELDLRYSSAEAHALWDAIVLGGSPQLNGMPGFSGMLSKEDSDALHTYVFDRARLAYDRQQSAADWPARR